MGIIQRVQTMKTWLTAAEIATEKLPYMPETEKGVLLMVERESWNEHPTLVRKRAGRGGGFEYHFQILPTLAQVAYSQKYMLVGAPDTAADATDELAATDLTGSAKLERDARLAIVNAFNVFSRGLNLGHAGRVAIFCDKYNAGKISVDTWVRDTIAQVSVRSLTRWRSAKQSGLVSKLAVDHAAKRKNKGVLDVANEGAVRMFILGLLAAQPHLSAMHVRTMCRSEFGDTLKVAFKNVQKTVEMPPLRTFQAALKTLKSDNRVVLTKLTNPDLYRSTMKMSGVGALRHITVPNALWQIDASPIDALCTDGRHTIYACIDIATRRVVLTVSKTPRASAVALLMRKSILAWGVPDVIKTDNGSDFVARDTKRLFESLGIEADVSDAYSPEQKGHVERVIKTFQHDFAALLDGFVGHNVAERKAIEGRKGFSQRLGEDDAALFNVKHSSIELQKLADEWVEKIYQHRPHSGLKNSTPFQVAASSNSIKRTVDVRALDLLLMPVAGKDGLRVVTKFGVKINHHHYLAPKVLAGETVFVRQDPDDLGKAYVFEKDGGRYLDEAICADLIGIHPETILRAAKEIQSEALIAATAQVKAEMKRIKKSGSLIERALEVAVRDIPNVLALPKREETHTTPQIDAALDAFAEFGERLHSTQAMTEEQAAMHRKLIAEMEDEQNEQSRLNVNALVEARQADFEAVRTAHVPSDSNVVALPESSRDRYRRAVAMRQAIERGEGDAVDGIWLGRYEQSDEFRAQSKDHEFFGDSYLAP